MFFFSLLVELFYNFNFFIVLVVVFVLWFVVFELNVWMYLIFFVVLVEFEFFLGWIE